MSQATKEADGTGGSKQRGYSTIARLKLNSSDELKQEYEQANNKYIKELKKLEANSEELKVELLDSYSEKSLLLRIKAMYDLVLSDPFMLVIYIIFSLILLILEFSVIIAKYGIATTNYERKVELIEKIGERRINELSAMDSLVYNKDSLYYDTNNTRNKYPKYLNG
jgi:hypothetical protein